MFQKKKHIIRLYVKDLGKRGGAGVIFACLADMKVFFVAEQPLFTEWSYRAVSKSY